MKYAIGYAASVGETGIIDAIDYCKKEGFHAVEINTNIPCFFPEKYSKEDRAYIKKYAQNNGIKLTLHGPEDITLLQPSQILREAGLKRYQEIIDFGFDIGALNMTIHIGPSVNFTMYNSTVYMDELELEFFRDILRQSLEVLSEYSKGKINVCIENSGRFTENFVQKILEEILEDLNIYLTWDIGHSYKNKFKEWEFFSNKLSKIKVCHVHDHSDTSDHQVIGEGNLDFIKHFSLLQGNDIIYIIEVRPRAKALESRKNLEQILKENNL